MSRIGYSTIAVAFAVLIASTPSGAVSNGPSSATFQTADGATVHLADYKGKVVLVDFWASWCQPCEASFPALDALHRDLENRGVEVLAVNLDERRRDADRFLGTHPHTMTVLFDPKGTSPAAFGVKGMPSSFLLDRAGTIRFTHMGYTSDVAARYRQEIAELLSEH